MKSLREFAQESAIRDLESLMEPFSGKALVLRPTDEGRIEARLIPEHEESSDLGVSDR